MGSVTDYIKCPRCGQENCIFNCHTTGEHNLNCLECGYRKTTQFKTDDNGNFIKKDETKGDEISNLILETTCIANPYCAYDIETDSSSACGTLETEEEYKKFVSDMLSIVDEENNIKKVVISKLVGNKIKKEVIFDSQSITILPKV